MAAMDLGRMPFFYSQDGRLIQVDYALAAVARGSTTVGLKTPDFAVLSGHVKPTRTLLDPGEKVFLVDDHVGVTGSGYIGDLNTLVDAVRIEAQRNRLAFDEPIDVGSLARHLGQYLHSLTMYAVRPLAASVILAGVDELGVQLMQVDPSGTTFPGSGFAIGHAADGALEVIRAGYRPDLALDEALELTSKAIVESNGDGTAIEHGLVTRDTKRFEKRRTEGVAAA